MKSKRFEVLGNRPVNKDGYVKEWPEVGLIAMNSPLDPKTKYSYRKWKSYRIRW